MRADSDVLLLPKAVFKLLPMVFLQVLQRRQNNALFLCCSFTKATFTASFKGSVQPYLGAKACCGYQG